MRGTRRLGGQSRLAQTGLTADEDDLATFVVGDPLEGIGEEGGLDVAPDHADRRPDGQARLEGHARASPGIDERLPQHLDGLDGIGEALQGHGPDGPAGVPVPPSRHQGHDGGGQDLPTLADVAESGRLDDRIPVVVTFLDRDLAATQPDAQAHGVRAVAVVPLHDLLHGHRTGQGSRRRGERDHDAVAQALDLVATRGGHGLAQGGEVVAPHLVGGLGRHPQRELRRADHIAEENGHVFAGHVSPPRPYGTGRPKRPHVKAAGGHGQPLLILVGVMEAGAPPSARRAPPGRHPGVRGRSRCPRRSAARR